MGEILPRRRPVTGHPGQLPSQPPRVTRHPGQSRVTRPSPRAAREKSWSTREVSRLSGDLARLTREESWLARENPGTPGPSPGSPASRRRCPTSSSASRKPSPFEVTICDLKLACGGGRSFEVPIWHLKMESRLRPSSARTRGRTWGCPRWRRRTLCRTSFAGQRGCRTRGRTCRRSSWRRSSGRRRR